MLSHSQVRFLKIHLYKIPVVVYVNVSLKNIIFLGMERNKVCVTVFQT